MSLKRKVIRFGNNLNSLIFSWPLLKNLKYEVVRVNENYPTWNNDTTWGLCAFFVKHSKSRKYMPPLDWSHITIFWLLLIVTCLNKLENCHTSVLLPLCLVAEQILPWVSVPANCNLNGEHRNEDMCLFIELYYYSGKVPWSLVKEISYPH